MDYIKLKVGYENLRYQKIALIKALPVQTMHNIYLLMASCEISDATYIVIPPEQMAINGVRNVSSFSVGWRSSRKGVLL
jgi:hypothetical protein